MAKYSIVNLKEVEDQAPKFGHGDNHEARFATKPLGLGHSGLSYQKLFPGKRSPFGHNHNQQEEVFVILNGSGVAKLDEQEVKVKAFDVIRIPPQTMRAFQAGDDGLEFIVYGAPKAGMEDVNMDKDWWTD